MLIPGSGYIQCGQLGAANIHGNNFERLILSMNLNQYCVTLKTYLGPFYFSQFVGSCLKVRPNMSGVKGSGILMRRHHRYLLLGREASV